MRKHSGQPPLSRWRTRLLSLLLLLVALSIRAQTPFQPTFVPGGDVYDTSGNLVNATEGGVLQVGSLFYLWGLDRSQNNYRFQAVNLYSSPDLKTWTFVNQILKSTSDTLLSNGAIIERPKLLRNATTGQFVLWMHYEGHNAYHVAEVAYATCNTIGGNYTFQNHFRPLGLDSRDMNTYQDTDGKAYLISSINVNSQTSIVELDSTYTVPKRIVFRSTGVGCEGHAIIKKNGVYFWLLSSCSGWETNDNHYVTATSLAGPWTNRGNFAPGGSHTFQSQVTYAFQVTGTGGSTYVYMGDRWVPSNFSSTRSVILPLQISGTSLSMGWYDQWSINPAAGTWQAGPAITWTGNYRIVNRSSGKVLGVAGSSTANAAPVQQFTASPATSRQWVIRNNGWGEYRLDNVNSGKSLEMNNKTRTLGAPTQQGTWSNDFDQRWNIIACGNGYYRFVNVNTLGRTLAVVGTATTDGATVGLAQFSFNNEAMWSFVPASTPLAALPASATAADCTAYPNPLADEVTFALTLHQPGPLEVSLHEAATGRLVRRLSYDHLGAGSHELRLTTADLPAGLYFYRTTLDGRPVTGKLTKLPQ